MSKSISSKTIDDDFTNDKSQLLKDYETMRTKSLQPSELRELFSRTKCCEKNCLVTKLRMPVINSQSQRSSSSIIPLTHLIYGGPCSQSNNKNNKTNEPVSIEEFENMIWDARELLRTMRVF